MEIVVPLDATQITTAVIYRTELPPAATLILAHGAGR